MFFSPKVFPMYLRLLLLIHMQYFCEKKKNIYVTQFGISKLQRNSAITIFLEHYKAFRTATFHNFFIRAAPTCAPKHARK